MPRPTRDCLFISHSHQDSQWLDRLKPMLEPLVGETRITVWNDRMIRPTGRWDRQIREALSRANVAVFLVSASFLASDFIARQEVPLVIEAAEKGDLEIVWIPVEACAYETSPVARYQAASDPAHPLSTLQRSEQDRVLAEISEHIKAAATEISEPAVAGWPPESWIQKVAGSFKDEPEFDEILRLGREIRQSDRPDSPS